MVGGCFAQGEGCCGVQTRLRGSDLGGGLLGLEGEVEASCFAMDGADEREERKGKEDLLEVGVVVVVLICVVGEEKWSS